MRNIVMLSVMLTVIYAECHIQALMPTVIMLNVVMLSAVAPFYDTRPSLVKKY
jgi:hypothetical protein